MKDDYLKFADHEEARSKLIEAGVEVPDVLGYLDTGLREGMLIIKPVGGNSAGIVYAATGEMETDAEGIEYPVMASVPGFHVNIRMTDEATLPAALAAFEVTPEPVTPAERFS